MPSMITHHFFAEELYEQLFEKIGTSKDEYDAFLLGSQGPDPLFYLYSNPSLVKHIDLGHLMHREKTNELLVALKNSLSVLNEEELPAGRAYAQGFLCHYALDSTVHPLVYAQVYALCDAGVDDLDRDDESALHSLIETELDEMVLWNKKQRTIRSFTPSFEILRADSLAMTAICKIYLYLCMNVFCRVIPLNTFSQGVNGYRGTTSLLHDPHGNKAPLIGMLEKAVRNGRYSVLQPKRYSVLRAMVYRPIELKESSFENRQRETWVNPFSGQQRTESFWDLYEQAKAAASEAIRIFEKDSFGLSEAQQITQNLNFAGESIVAQLLCIENEATETKEDRKD